MHNVASKYLGNAMHLCPFFSAVPYMLKPDQGRRNWRAGGAIVPPTLPTNIKQEKTREIDWSNFEYEANTNTGNGN